MIGTITHGSASWLTIGTNVQNLHLPCSLLLRSTGRLTGSIIQKPIALHFMGHFTVN